MEANAELAAVVVKNFDEVQQIWDELDHFKRHRQVKGDHPLFRAEAQKQELSGMSDVALLKLLRNRPADILKYTKVRIPAAASEERRSAMEEKVAEWRRALEAARAEAKRRGVVQ